MGDDGPGPTGDRFFFLHMQKTAGTSLLVALRRRFPPEVVYPGEHDTGRSGGTIDVDHLLRRWEEIGDRARLVAGHFPLCTTELLGGGFRTFTVLRDPVERTLSFLRHQRALDGWARDHTLEEIYDEPIRHHGLIRNHMVKMLSLTPETMQAGTMTHVHFDEGHLDAARRALVEDVDVFGFQDDMAGFYASLDARFGWSLPAPLVTNTTEPVDVDEAFRARIAADNDLDVRFYAFARERHAAERG